MDNGISSDTPSHSILFFHCSFLQAMQIAGIDGESVLLMMDDHQFVQATFLQLINSLLSAGEVPGLYAAEELDHLLAPLREKAADEGYRGMHNTASNVLLQIYSLCNVVVVVLR